MSLTEKASIGAGVWGLKRWLKRAGPKAIEEAKMEAAKVVDRQTGQPSDQPTRKTVAGHLGGAGILATLIVTIVQWAGYDISVQEATVLAGLIGGVIGYFVPNGRVA